MTKPVASLAGWVIAFSHIGILPLGVMAQQAASATPVANEALDSPDENTVHNALMRLGKSPEEARKALGRLTQLLNCNRSEKSIHAIDAEAATVLGTLGGEAKNAVPVLLERMKSQGRSPNYNTLAAEALARIDGLKPAITRVLILEFGSGCGAVALFDTSLPQSHAAEIVRHLINLTADADPAVREKACAILGDNEAYSGTASFKTKDLLAKAGAISAEIPDALARAMYDPQLRVQVAAAQGLLVRSPMRSEETIPVVVAGLRAGFFRNKKGGGGGGVPAFMLAQISNRDKVLQSLLPLLEETKNGTSNETIEVLAKLPVQAQLKEWLKTAQNKTQRAAAATALSKTAERSQFFGDLLAALHDPELEVRFAAALGYVSNRWRAPLEPEVIAVLVEGIESNHKPTRMAGFQWLRVVEKSALPATAALKKLTHDSDLEIRGAAALTLVAVNPKEGSEAVLPLKESLENTNGWQSIAIIDALAVLGPQASPSLPAIEKIYRAEGISHEKAHAAMAVAMIDPHGQGTEAVRVLVQMLCERKSGRVAPDRIVELLMMIGPTAKPSVPILIEELSDPKKALTTVALAIVKIDPDSAQPARDWIRAQLAKGAKEDHVLDLAREIPKLGAAAKPLIPELLEMLKSSEVYIRQRAILTLGNLGSDGADALPALRELTKSDADAGVKKYATRAMAQIEGK